MPIETEIDSGSVDTAHIYLTGNCFSESVHCIDFSKSSFDSDGYGRVHEGKERRYVCRIFLWNID